jgi:predicted dehydrogenase
MSDKEFVKAAVIGCGGISNQYKLVNMVIKNTKIVAGMDLDIKKAKRIGGKDHAYTDIEELYKNEDFDVAYIATPHFLHKPMIKQAFEEGKHVFCEKPATISVEDARVIRKWDNQYSNLKLGFNYMYRYSHDCYRLARGIQNNHIGKIHYANCSVLRTRTQKYFDKGAWKGKKEQAGGGTMLIQASHILDILIWALGDPKTVMGKIDTLKFEGITVEDVGFGIIEFESGAIAQINSSMIITPHMKFSKIEDLHIFGENGRGHYQGLWPRSKLKWKGVKKYKCKKHAKGISHIGKSIKSFGNWVLHDTPFLNTIDESARVLTLIETLYKSSETGKKEEIEKL